MGLDTLSEQDYQQLYAQPESLRKNYALSIVTPIYDRPQHLLNLIESLLRQEECDFAEIEMVIVDDGGQSEALPAIRQMSLPFALRYYGYPRRGRQVSKARNIGIREARGTVILFLDSDALASPRLVADHLARHRNHPRIMIQGQMYELPSGSKAGFSRWMNVDIPFGSVKKWVTSRLRRMQFSLINFLYSRNRRGLFFCTMHASVRREHLLQVGGFDHAFDGCWGDEDCDLGLRLEEAGLRLVWGNRTFVYHQWHPVTLQENVRDNRIRLLLKHPWLIGFPVVSVMPNVFYGCTPSELARLHAHEESTVAQEKSKAARPEMKILYQHDPFPEIPPLLSLIVTTCNREAFADGFLQSLQAQTLDLRQVELIVADDGSTDDTLAHFQRSKLGCRVRYLWQPHQGFRAASSRNNGLRMAAADVIVMTDMDAVLDPRFLEAHYRSQADRQNLILCGLAYYLKQQVSDARVLQSGRSFRFKLKCLVEKTRQPYLQWLARQGRYPIGTVVSTINCSFRRSGLAASQELDESFDGIYGDEDIEFFHRLQRAGCTVQFLNEALVFHRWHAMNPSWQNALENRCLLLLRHPDLIQQELINLQVNRYYRKTICEVRCHRLWLERLRFLGKPAFKNRRPGEAFRSLLRILLPACWHALRKPGRGSGGFMHAGAQK